MNLDVETLTNSDTGIRLLSTIAARIPSRLGYGIADLTAQLLAQQRTSELVRAVRGNQRVVLGEGCSSAVLDQTVHETIRLAARSIFDLYHYLPDPDAIGRMIVLDPTAQRLARRYLSEDRGLLLVGIHLSSFDLLVRWFCRQWMQLMVLTLPDPQGGRRTEYEMRRQLGVNLVPATIPGLRRALKHLESGGAVLTGIDRPVPKPRLLPRFFGRPAALPVHHVFLATRARVPLAVVAATLEHDGQYHVRTSDLIEFHDGHGGDDQMLRNAETVLRVAEGFIRRAPQQWSMPLPVWPCTIDPVRE